MAFTFTKVGYDPQAKQAIYTATTDTSSAAGTLNPGFTPTQVTIWDSTNANKYEWNAGMADASMFKTVTAGTFTYASSNGITPISTTAQQGVTIGTGVHTNSSSYTIVLRG